MISFSLTSLVIKYWRRKIYSCEKKPNITLLFYRSTFSEKHFLADEFFKLISNSKPTQKLKLPHDVCKVKKKKLRCTYKISEISAKSTFLRTLCGGIESLAFHLGGLMHWWILKAFLVWACEIISGYVYQAVLPMRFSIFFSAHWYEWMHVSFVRPQIK